MSIFGTLLKAGFDVLESPIEIAKDIATLGGACTDQEEPYTAAKLR
jgi:hypothetical protein